MVVLKLIGAIDRKDKGTWRLRDQRWSYKRIMVK